MKQLTAIRYVLGSYLFDRYLWMSRLHFLIDGRLGLMGSCGGSLVSRNVILTAAHASWGAGLCATIKQIQKPAVVVLGPLLCTELSTAASPPAMKRVSPARPTLPQCVSLVRKGYSNVFVRVGAYNALTDDALRPVSAAVGAAVGSDKAVRMKAKRAIKRHSCASATRCPAGQVPPASGEGDLGPPQVRLDLLRSLARGTGSQAGWLDSWLGCKQGVPPRLLPHVMVCHPPLAAQKYCSYIERGEDQITSPNDLALMLLDTPLPEAFPVIHLAGRKWREIY